MVRAIFKNVVLAAAGPLPGQFTDENLAKWIELRKGAFSRELDERVTHLLCTEELLKERGPRVKAALTQYKKVHLVDVDWLNISCIREKKQKEREYDLRTIIEAEKEEERRLARVEKGNLEEERFVNSNFFHIYRDGTHFPYEITITRDDEDTGNVGQRYILFLFESNAKPHLYWFAAKFWRKKRDNRPSYYRPTTCSGLKAEHYRLFTSFFKKKTGVEWCERALEAGVSRKGLFRYMPPTGGKPVGEDLQQAIHSEIKQDPKAVAPPISSYHSTKEAIVGETNDTMAPTKRKGDIIPDPQDTLGATETPTKRRVRPRKDLLPEEVPEEEDLASIGIPHVKDDDTDEDYVPGKKTSTPKKPKKKRGRKKGVPVVETPSPDCTPTEDAAPKKVTPEKHDAAERGSSEDPFRIEPQSQRGIGGEKGTAQGSSNTRGSSDTQGFPNTQCGTQNLPNTDMELGSDVLLARLVETYKPIYDSHNKPTNLSGLGGKPPSNAPQMFGATYGLEGQRTTKFGSAFGQGLNQSSPIQDFNALLSGNNFSAQQAASGYAPRSANRSLQMMSQSQPVCRSGSIIPDGIAQMADPFVVENPHLSGLHDSIGQSLVSKHGFSHYQTMGYNFPNVGVSLMAQNQVNMQGLGGPTMGTDLPAFEFPPVAENRMGYPGQTAGRNHPGSLVFQSAEDYILSPGGLTHGSYPIFEDDQSGTFPVDVFAQAGMTSGDRPELEPLTEAKQKMNLQKPGVNLQLEKTQVQSPYAESSFAVEERAKDDVKINTASENNGADTDDVGSCVAATKPGTELCEVVNKDKEEGKGERERDEGGGDQSEGEGEDEDQRAYTEKIRDKGVCDVQGAPSSACQPQACAKSPGQAPASRLEQQQAAVSDPETTKLLDQPGNPHSDPDNKRNTQSKDTMPQNEVSKPTANAQPEGNKKKLTPWEEYLQTPEGHLLMYGSAGKSKPNMHIDLPTFNAANLKLPESKRKRNATKRDAMLHASGQQMTTQGPYTDTSQRGAVPGVSRPSRPAAYFTDPMFSQVPGAPTAFAA